MPDITAVIFDLGRVLVELHTDVEGARASGMQAVRFTGEPGLRRELERFRVL